MNWYIRYYFYFTHEETEVGEVGNKLYWNRRKVCESSRRKLCLSKGDMNDFTMKNFGRHHLNHMFKVNLTNYWSNWLLVPPDMMHWEEHNNISVILLPKTQNLNLTVRKIDRPKLRDSVQNEWLVFIKYVNGLKDKDWGSVQD